MRPGYVYIMANERPTLYTGVTSNLIKRVFDHKSNQGSRFTAKYKLHKLVFYEKLESIINAIIREKQIKDLDRKDKIALIRKYNPDLKDLYPTLVWFWASSSTVLSSLPKGQNDEGRLDTGNRSNFDLTSASTHEQK